MTEDFTEMERRVIKERYTDSDSKIAENLGMSINDMRDLYKSTISKISKNIYEMHENKTFKEYYEGCLPEMQLMIGLVAHNVPVAEMTKILLNEPLFSSIDESFVEGTVNMIKLDALKRGFNSVTEAWKSLDVL